MLDKTFNPATVEESTYKKWEQSGAFACDPQSSRRPYTIMMPPPNVTGSLHVGHALTYTLQDILIRFMRMLGRDVLWQPGTDHAGIATQMVVERQLSAQGKSRHDLGRDEFIKRVWEWKQESGDLIVRQQRRLGISPDWERQRFTMDEGLSTAVTKVFVDLYKEGLIYRDKRLVNWDPKMQSAISDLEVLSQETKGNLWYIRYPLVESPEEFVTIATTRPETLLGDVAVAVHPSDERYKHLIGHQLRVPLCDRVVPIIGDEYCDPELGTGAVKITPAHDFNDFEVARRHDLPMINILDTRAHILAEDFIPQAYHGLSVEKGREAVLADLEKLTLIEQITPHTLNVPFGERSGAVVQPLLTDQWFLNAKILAEPALKAVEEGKTQFIPEHWASTYFEWLRNIQPWCISRQIWWGHQIPAWFGPDGTYFVAETEADALQQAEEHYKTPTSLTRDNDVLDTWFSSALWPFTTLGWPNNTEELKRYYPTDVLDTGHDIIFFWVARMMMMGIHFMGDVPFKTVYIHALIRDEKGAKMSKSKGNVIDPLGLMDKYGADAMRFTLASMAVPGRDIKLGESRIEGSRNFMTKLWNAARFLQMNHCGYDSSFDPLTAKNRLNRWIIGGVATLSNQVHQALLGYRFDEAATCLYQFLWGSYCDYYLEFLKPVLMQETETEEQLECRQAAVWALMQILKLAHPIIPFITEVLWEDFTSGQEGQLMLQGWPEFGRETVTEGYSDTEANREIDWIVELIQEIRSRRAELNVPPSAQLIMHIYEADSDIEERVKRYELILLRLGRLSSIQIHADHPSIAKGVVQFIVGKVTVILPLGDAIDVNAEMTRLDNDITKLDYDVVTQRHRLENPEFLAKAKPEVVQELVERVELMEERKARLQQALKRLS